MIVAALLPVRPDLAHGGGKIVVCDEDRPAVAIATERLAWEEAGAGDRGHVATLAAAILGTEALGGVLNDRNTVPFADGIDLVHVGCLAVKGNRNDRLGGRG